MSKRLFFATLGLFTVTLSAIPALAQDALSTQRQATLGGTDQRGLPDPSTLPPLFGSSLFLVPKGAALAPALGLALGSAEPGAVPAPATSSAASAAGRTNFDPGYVIQPGDAIDVQLFGAAAISAPSPSMPMATSSSRRSARCMSAAPRPVRSTL